MATPKHDVRVHIGCAAGKITVDPDPFWIYRCENEQVRWVCVQDHKHGNANDPCFKVHFSKRKPRGRSRAGSKTGSPFEMNRFAGHALSGHPTSEAKDNQKYKYTVTVKGKVPLDPEGGVKP